MSDISIRTQWWQQATNQTGDFNRKDIRLMNACQNFENLSAVLYITIVNNCQENENHKWQFSHVAALKSSPLWNHHRLSRVMPQGRFWTARDSEYIKPLPKFTERREFSPDMIFFQASRLWHLYSPLFWGGVFNLFFFCWIGTIQGIDNCEHHDRGWKQLNALKLQQTALRGLINWDKTP